MIHIYIYIYIYIYSNICIHILYTNLIGISVSSSMGGSSYASAYIDPSEDVSRPSI